jgi:hypothetical protein
LGREKKNRILPLDTLRLEIVYSDHDEWYAAPGDKNFSATNPIRFITQGMIGNGIFAVLLNNILLSGGATFLIVVRKGSKGGKRSDTTIAGPGRLVETRST